MKINRLYDKLCRLVQYALMLLFGFVVLIPFYVLLFVAFNHRSRPLSLGVFSPPALTLENLSEAWSRSHLGVAFVNSLFITVTACVIVVFLGACAGYAFARFPNKFNRFWFNLFLMCMMIPGIINTVPLYIIMSAIGGANNRFAMATLLAALRLPFCVFLYTSFIESFGRDTEEAALIDGCSPFSAFWRITIHILKPITATVIITSSVSFWNNYSQSVFFLTKNTMQTIPLAMRYFFSEYNAEWNLVAAAAFIGIVPVVLMFLTLQKYFVKGLAAGAIK
jgi:raffinose/stachyose/melibiose transport system permease protein